MKIREKELNNIINDKKSGSLDILLRLKKHLMKVCSDEAYMKYVIEVSENKLNHFTAVQNFLKDLKKVFKNFNQKELKIYLKKSVDEQENSIQNLFERNKKLLMKNRVITTISFSKTLLEIFKLLYKENPELKVFITESRPNYEGKLLAKKLIKEEVNSHLIVDAMMNYAVQKSDCIIIGADQILKNGNVVNKTGSYPLALCAKANKKPFYVIATKDKITKKNKYFPTEYSSDEIWEYKNSKLQITNYYFEEIPKNLITKILI